MIFIPLIFAAAGSSGALIVSQIFKKKINISVKF